MADGAVRYSPIPAAASPAVRFPTVEFPLASRGQPAVVAETVTRRFGRRWALRGVSLTVQAGEVVGVEGHNGSGKSTLLRILATALKPTTGSVRVFGADVVRDGDEVRGQVAFLAHFPGLYDDLTAAENLRFAARMLGRPVAEIPVLLERVGLLREADEVVRRFSAGMQRRLSLARLLLQRPRLLLLDEPYNNFDAQGIALVNEVIVGVREAGGAAMVVLHDRHSAAALLDRVVCLSAGLVEPDVADRDGKGALRPSRPMIALAGEG
jgi:heme exporter protein A